MNKTIKYEVYGKQFKYITAMNEGRNFDGKFTKGHPGFKPKGAVSRKKQKQDQLLNQVFSYFDANMEETIRALKPNQLAKFYLNLTKLVLPKLKRIPYEPNPPIESEEIEENNSKDKKIIFEIVEIDKQKPINPKHTIPNQ